MGAPFQIQVASIAIVLAVGRVYAVAVVAVLLVLFILTVALTGVGLTRARVVVEVILVHLQDVHAWLECLNSDCRDTDIIIKDIIINNNN